MTISLVQQGTSQQVPPPIPPLPPEPGASTGGRVVVLQQEGGAVTGVTADQAAQQATRNAAEAQRNAAIAIRNAIEAQRNAVGSTTQVPDLPFDPAAMLAQATPIVGMTLAMMVVLFIGWPLARAFGRRMDRRAELGTVRAADLQPQIRQLQESVDAMAIELERISEAQRFQAKLLADRAAAALPEPERR